MTLYLDSSALVKRYVAEQGSDDVVVAMDRAETWSSCHLAFVETVRAVHLRAGVKGVQRVRGEWPNVDIVEVNRGLVEGAARLAVAAGLRTLDALHLAAALTLPAESLVFATWDLRLHLAAREYGLHTLPAKLP